MNENPKTHLERALIFLLFRLSFLMRFLRHFSRILWIKGDRETESGAGDEVGYNVEERGGREEGDGQLRTVRELGMSSLEWVFWCVMGREVNASQTTQVDQTDPVWASATRRA